MAAPNIEMVAASLKNCNIRHGAAHVSPNPFPPNGEDLAANGGDGEAAAAATLELKSEIALPYQWEQFLDLETGEIYYINRVDGSKTTTDPRELLPRGYISSEDNCNDEADENEEYAEYEDTSDDDDSSDDSDGFSSAFSSSSSSSSSSFSSSSCSTSSSASSSDGTQRGPVLVTAGCRNCMMYHMIPKREKLCPKCGELLLHFGRNANRGG